MINLSAIILTKNAEDMIADCLDSVSFCDEIIVIDDGSTDRTTEIAKLQGVKVFSIISRSFSERRNYGLKKAKNKWILYIDADERISSELKENIKKTIGENSEFSAYRLQRKNFYFGTYEWPYIEKLERLFKKNALKEWHGQLHETAQVNGEIGDLDGYLLHYTHRDLTSMVEKTIVWSEIEAELRLDAHHPKMTWWRFPRVMLTAFFNSYVKQKGYKAGTAGLVESIYQAFSMFITYARLWEMQSQLKNKNA
ncbi:glycosyltransferase family 2 protein [Candidatus Roizmanbacteria bacterium]|nr:glycosyltransferase family 2 protein [Candidatus Roizmanbacteria bacterium]